MITAWQPGPSLRDNDDFRLAARTLDAAGAYTAYLTDRTQGSDAVVDGQTAGAPAREPYSVVGVGVGQDGAGAAYTSVVLVHTSEQAARDNVDRLTRRIREATSAPTGRPWSELFPSVDIHVEGRTLVATLTGSSLGPQFILQRDPLLLHR